MRRLGPAAWLILALSTSRAIAGDEPRPTSDPAAAEFFEKEVRPILAERCQGCHGASKHKNGLRLDSRAAALAGGITGPAVVPGKPEESLLIDAINYGDLQMPPKAKLTAPEIAALTKWVALGAPWPGDASKPAARPAFDLKERAKHWSFQPLRDPAPPAVKAADWPITPVDRFLLAALEAKGLQPAGEADRRALIRRVTFDLIGLPPTPAEVEAFVADPAPDAYEKVVDRLLSSPHYGERWGRHWLDLVRFAETAGHEFDYDTPNAFRYRDYVIRAFNDDLSYDRFVVEHIAGDLLDPPRCHPVEGFNESVLATGFFALGEGTHSPVDVREDQVRRIDNQIDVLSKAFLGLTVACARCHDHKFDPISTRDYYALAGHLRSTRHQHAFLDPPARIGTKVAELSALKAAMAAELTGGHVGLDVAAGLMATRVATPQPLPAGERGSNHPPSPVGEGRGEGGGASPAAKPITLTLPLGGGDRKDLPLPHGERAGVRGTTVAEAPNDGLLRRWREALRNQQAPSPDHPLYAWAALSDPSASRRRIVEGLKARPAAADDSVLFEDFNAPSFGDWSVTGDAFGDGPSRPGDWRPGEEGPIPVAAGQAHSGLVSDRLQGVLRSKTFTIQHKYIHYLASGRRGRINLVVDGLEKIRDPIYGGLTIRVDGADARRWYAQDVGMWGGQEAYIEIADGAAVAYDSGRAEFSPGDGFIAVDEIRFSDQAAPPPRAGRFALDVLDDPEADTPEGLAARFGRAVESALDDWRAGRLGAGGRDAERVAVLGWLTDRGLIRLGAIPDDLRARYRAVEATIPPPTLAPAVIDGTGEDERVLVRGNHNTPGDVVPRRFLEAIAGPDQAAPRAGSGRLELARRMVDRSDPLLPRVMVNRIWKHHFGEGLVRSPDDFGVMGQPPTHPELLDWLASRFVEGGWSIKRLHRLMVLSRAYRMRSVPVPGSERIDPDNRLLHRTNVRRLEAEAIRDAMLAASGRLDPTMFGPSVPPHLTPFMDGRGRPAASGPLDGDGRRSLYLNVRRNFLTPMLLAFDFPAPASTMGRRNVSNVPAQALTLLNDPFVIDQARLWADRLLAPPGRSRDDRLRDLYLTAFGRPPSDAERAEALAFLAGDDGPRGWAELCHVLFNVKEFIFVR
jgi:mono/diheme cytochrome c family protein